MTTNKLVHTAISHDIVEQILRAEAEDREYAKLAEALLCSPEFNNAADKAKLALLGTDCVSLGAIVAELAKAGFPIEIRAFDATTRYLRQWKPEILMGFLRELLETPAHAAAVSLSLDRDKLEAELGPSLGIFGPTHQDFSGVSSDDNDSSSLIRPGKPDHNDLTVHCRARVGRALSIVTTAPPSVTAIDILTGLVLEIAGVTPPTRSKNPDHARRERVRRAVPRSSLGRRHQK